MKSILAKPNKENLTTFVSIGSILILIGFTDFLVNTFLNINLTFINNYKLFSSFLVPILFSTILTLLMKRKEYDGTYL